MRRDIGAALFALLALGACGRSKDEQLLDERRSICFDLAVTHATMQQAFVQLSPQHYCGPATEVSTSFSRPADGTLDGCPFDGTSLVAERFEWHAVDDKLCAGFACSYFCVLFYPGTAPVLDAPICGARFLTRQGPLCFL
jgi:hypothetical protein